MTDKVNVLIVSKNDLFPGLSEEIAAVDQRVAVRDGTASFAAELRRQGRTGAWVDRLAALAAQAQPAGPPKEDLNDLLAQAEVVFVMSLIPDGMAARAPRLRWIHLGNAGIEPYQSAGITTPRIMMTNARGVHSIGIAEHVLSLTFALAKDIPRLLDNQRQRRWDRFVTPELRDKVMGIIGLGAIGTETAKLARGVGMKVIATKRSAAVTESNVSGVDELYPPSEFRQILSQSDFVVIAVPLTGETKDMVGEQELRSMKPSAFLINISRGEIVNQPALITALQQGWIAGAGLDAFAVEPLPRESELWALPNVILSPHMSGSTERRNDRMVSLFCENLQRYLAGRELLNLIDIKKGY